MKQRTENSGLIDLDALLREAGTREVAAESPPAPAVVEAAPKAAKVVEAAPMSRVVAKEVPQPPSKTNVTDDSLEAVSCEPRTDPWIATPSTADKTAASEKAATSNKTPSVAPIQALTPARARGGYRKSVAIGLSLALVAGGVVLFRPRTAVAPQAAAPTIAIPAPTEAPKAAAALPPAEATDIAALSANDLPAAAASASSQARARANAPTSKQAPAADPTKPALLTEADLAPSSAEHGDLGSAMRGAVGPNDKPTAIATPESTGPSASQLHPSQGALVGAIGAVLPTARACLGADDPVRNGLVVFKSDGTVARVELRGSKPEDECVRAALAKAKVAPFVDDTFSTKVTVRP